MEDRGGHGPDTRTGSVNDEIRGKLARLAAAYTPEWNFTEKDPDIGSVIALIYAAQMADNRKRYDTFPERFRIELADMLGISPRPARAAESIVVMKAGENIGTGIPMSSGTKLSAQGEQGEELIFETQQDLFVLGMGISDIVGTCADRAQVYAYRGELKREPLLPELAKLRREAGEQGSRGIWQQALLLFHEYLFDSAGGEVAIRFCGKPDAGTLAGIFTDSSRYRFLYYAGDGLREAEARREGDLVMLRRNKQAGKVRRDGKEYAVLVLQQLAAGGEARVSSIRIQGGDGGAAQADYVSDGLTDLPAEEFLPFGRELSPYQECLIGQAEVFAQKGALITVEFELSFTEQRYSYEKEKTEGKLPFIQRKPKYQTDDRPVSCIAGETVFEYFNGSGWRRLLVQGGAEGLFGDRRNAGKCSLVFRAPEDWGETEEGGFRGRCLRIRLVRADNCYLRPAVHTCPVIKGLRARYSYEGREQAPARILRLSGREWKDLTFALRNGEECAAFRAFPYEGRALYLGFWSRPEQGPIGLFVKLREQGRLKKGRVEWEYSTERGFRPLRVRDGTGGLEESGNVIWEPPSDMARFPVAGAARYWLRVVCRDGGMEELWRFPGIIEDILPNAVLVRNVETSKPEDYYMDTVRANMSFPLYGDNILDVEVWVNERRELTGEEMEELMARMPEKVLAECNDSGEIEEFFVKWQEVESFCGSGRADRHYRIDRMENRLLFGDGIHTRIPRNTSETAFRVIRRSCNGSLGNVPPGSISGFHGKMLFIDEVFNPVPGYGGSGMESLSGLLTRGSSLLSGRGRLISEADYVREALGFSEDIMQAACICGQDRDGREEEGRLHLVVLMKDYKQGSNSFRRIRKELAAYLSGRCELTMQERQIWVEEPLFVPVSVTLWVRVRDREDGFRIQRECREQIERYLEPGSGPGQGRQIGSLPGEEQIAMLLHTLERECRIERYCITARCGEGGKETELKRAIASPFAVCCNGEHHIYINGGMQDAGP